ncbi:hypothetical protein F444_19838 [Phytophthora nicotianae P1976]|uniref:Uncharacterized protein n=1 Tax=Phytophthora nicotianae P1976 TaxID=1317066 RepID=A0A080Z6G8_PHYNI|nr:hypothetical protein F444_19838 [Phytophthora nicotianae P1976]
MSSTGSSTFRCTTSSAPCPSETVVEPLPKVAVKMLFVVNFGNSPIGHFLSSEGPETFQRGCMAVRDDIQRRETATLWYPTDLAAVFRTVGGSDIHVWCTPSLSFNLYQTVSASFLWVVNVPRRRKHGRLVVPAMRGLKAPGTTLRRRDPAGNASPDPANQWHPSVSPCLGGIELVAPAMPSCACATPASPGVLPWITSHHNILKEGYSQRG